MVTEATSCQALQSELENHSVEERALTRWQKFRLVVKVVELRLRFIALMAITALAFVYFDELQNRYEKWTRPATHAHVGVSEVEYFCPMHPQVVQDQPGSCPLCGMPLSRRKKGEKATVSARGTAQIELAQFQVEQAGIKTVEVTYAPLLQTVTTVGNVAFDERGLANISSRVPGRTRVETLHVNVTGQEVEVGQVLAELYSPELSQAIQELINSARRAQVPSSGQSDVARALISERQSMVRASAEKLSRWGLTSGQIDEILKTNKTDFKFSILSPIRGTVIKKNIVQGQEIIEGFNMFEVADLRTVWVQARVFERQLGLIRLGQRVEAHVEAFPGETFYGQVEFIQPTVDTATRTLEVRYALENQNKRLRPGMFATVTLKTSVAETPEYRARAAQRSSGTSVRQAGYAKADDQKLCVVTGAKLGSMGDPVSTEVDRVKVWTCCAACPPKLRAEPARYLARLRVSRDDEVLSVPELAVIDTGTRKVVYIENEPGVFEGREVVLGPRTGDHFPVLEGLLPGEKVAAAGAFLIDAESRLNPTANASSISSTAATSTVPVHQH